MAEPFEGVAIAFVLHGGVVGFADLEVKVYDALATVWVGADNRIEVGSWPVIGQMESVFRIDAGAFEADEVHNGGVGRGEAVDVDGDKAAAVGVEGVGLLTRQGGVAGDGDVGEAVVRIELSGTDLIGIEHVGVVVRVDVENGSA